MLEPHPLEPAMATRSHFYYGWVIVASCTVIIAITYGMLYSYSVFFKPLADYFSWDRATVSMIFSASLFIRGAIAVGIGWLADRYGARKVMVFCGFMLGAGLVLSSWVHNLWQFFISYAVVEAIGLSGAFGVGTAMTSRWFDRNRGLALGIISSGSGLGTLLIVPIAERLIHAFDWSRAFFICGIVAGVVMIASALFLRPAPGAGLDGVNRPVSAANRENDIPNQQDKVPLWRIIGDSRMILIAAVSFLFFFGIQMMMVHLVNYATDMGIDSLVAASFISIIGAVSIAGRLSTGAGADRIGIYHTLVLTRVFLIVAFICIIFARSLWAFYVFAIIFGLPYGGEIPQIPFLIGKYFGTKAMATLVGINLFIVSISGALGPWMAGEIFDITRSYHWAFVAGALSGISSLILVFKLKGIAGATG